MTAVELARIQFATTSIYHFLFVPLTIGLALLTAMLQTAWHRGGRSEHLTLTRFFGTLLVINIAVGVVTGLVQEFQFGMNWSQYSRFVGDVFGAPLAMEGLVAFFLESTFLGLWVFGWGRLSKRVHLATIWAVAVGSALSAAFIMAANSWMQHPVGYQLDPATGHAQLTSIWALLTNGVFLRGYLHVLLASAVTAAVVMLGISAWHLRRGSSPEAFTRSARLAIGVLVPAAMLALLVGSELGVTEGEYQPMKIAAAEAQWTTCQPCSFSLFQVGGGNRDETPTKVIQVPHLLSLLATNSWNGQVVGLNDVQAQYQAQYGPGDYIPNVFVQYWSMRVMAYLGGLLLLLGVWAFWRRRRLVESPWLLRIAIWAIPVPFVVNTAGWMLTENGRQPWIVQGLLLTRDAASPTVGIGTIAASLGVFVLLYGALAVVDWLLMARFARKELDPVADLGPDDGVPSGPTDDPAAFQPTY
ncbi:cytochrome ubiquinol oxidase subunit I [Actinomycetospora endophytica]|uniref:Cytochrome ubiquinol oxidase subunit I n=1 Tax=Actinomycetospora endophytica TaxID=2291215 RepID=A0ABS8PCJ8_9PSEU|nr:cytochrome ubiquinol oxidase subunit I [Actinomycetospora endophytica]MCD2195215.1 cytochrome ubiquinol oxidase subunit I [Actinomycetospora endophytica]